MKPPPFEYYRATTAEEAIALLSRYGPDAKVLAGGQSLLPMLKFRLARPSVLVDLNWVRELAYVRQANGSVAFGAMARLADRAMRSPEAEATLLGQMGGRAAFEVAGAQAAAPLTPLADVHASSGYRRHLARVLVERALMQAWHRLSALHVSLASS
ncbi:MAG: FAD binding domain-containing protein [Nitrospinae bacterium]|nr:FAD binding domain-containing protein [Nitrospinota bacterium]